MRTINMLSSATKVKGQGVSSAYTEQVNLVQKGLADSYSVSINKLKYSDITHYHTIDPQFFLTMPFMKRKGTTLAYVHFVPETLEESIKLPFPIKKLFYKYVIRFYNNAEHLVVVNPYFIDVLEKYHVPRSKVTYIPNFVSEENFHALDQEAIRRTKTQYGIPEDKFVVLGAGQVQTRKGVLDFIETANSLPDIQFVWAGGFSFGAITEGYKELKKVIENPPSNVKFIGIVDREKMNEIYNMSNCLFQPSFSELFPMTVLEAMAIPKPILLRDLDIYHNILFDSYLRGSNVQEFAAVISELAKSSDYYQSGLDKSWKCHQLYSPEYVLNMWREYYNKLSSKNNRSRNHEK